MKEKLRARLEKPASRPPQVALGSANPLQVKIPILETSFSLTGQDILDALPPFPQMPSPALMPDWVGQLISKTMASFAPLATVEEVPPQVPLQVPSVDGYVFKPFSFTTPAKPIAKATLPSVIAAPSSETTFMVTKPGDLSYDKANCSVELDPDNGGPMVDLSGYQDLTRPPVTEDSYSVATATLPESFTAPVETPIMTTPTSMFKSSTHPEMLESEYKVEYSGNVKTLVQLVSDLPDGVTKQTGAQIIRLTMEAMGISMENVLSEAQTAQSELLDAARSNIKKIEEYKTIIRKLETESRFHQGKANELSEIIDLFILSNTLPNNPMDSGN